MITFTITFMFFRVKGFIAMNPTVAATRRAVVPTGRIMCGIPGLGAIPPP